MVYSAMKSSNVFSVIFLLTLKCFTPCQSTCSELDSHTYMNFVVRVWEHSVGLVWSTGSIVTPNVVIGICTKDFSPKQDGKEIRTVLHGIADSFRIRATSARLPQSKVNKSPDRLYDELSHHFSRGVKGETDPQKTICSKDYDVKEIFPHPWCQGSDFFEPSKWNFAAFVLKAERFDVIKHDIIPILPMAENVYTTMFAIDRFNSKRRARCQLAQFYAELSKTTDLIGYPYKSQNAYRSVPMKTECKFTPCYEKHHQEDEANGNTERVDYCHYLMTVPEGSMFCATRVNQEHFNDGMNYFDYENKDKDFDFEAAAQEEKEEVDKNVCVYDLSLILGAPMLCDGIVIGFVVMCHKKTLIFTSVVTIREFILSLTNSTYVPMILMDATEKGNQGDQQQTSTETHTSTATKTYAFPLIVIIFVYHLFNTHYEFYNLFLHFQSVGTWNNVWIHKY